jgi:hypothetical protein
MKNILQADDQPRDTTYLWHFTWVHNCVRNTAVSCPNIKSQNELGSRAIVGLPFRINRNSRLRRHSVACSFSGIMEYMVHGERRFPRVIAKMNVHTLRPDSDSSFAAKFVASLLTNSERHHELWSV